MPILTRISAATRSLANTVLSSRRGTSDVLVSMAPQMVGVVTGLLGSVLIARGLGPEGMGRYALVLSLAGIASSLSDLGIGQTAVRYASRASAAGDTPALMSVLRWAFRMRMVLTGIITAAFMLSVSRVASTIWHDPGLASYARIGLLGGLFTAFGAVPALYFQSIRRFGVNASIQTAQRLIVFAGVATLALCRQWSLYNLLFVQLATALISSAAFMAAVPARALWRNRKTDPPGHFWKPDIAAGTATAHAQDRHSPRRFAMYHIISSLVVMITMQCDVWMMGFYLEKVELGVYSAAARFALPLSILLGGLNTALWPRASALQTPAELRRLLKKTLLVSFALASGGAAYAVAAPLLAPLVFGESYREGVLIGQLLCLRSCLSILICPVGVLGYAMGLVRVYWLINLIQLAFVVALNMFLLPRFGAKGAAMALLANDLVGFAMAGMLLWRTMKEAGRPASGAHT